MLNQPHKKNWDRGLGGYVIDMGILPLRMISFHEKKKGIKMGYVAGILQKER